MQSDFVNRANTEYIDQLYQRHHELARQEPHRGVLVLSVELLRRSVAVEVDCTWVVPA